MIGLDIGVDVVRLTFDSAFEFSRLGVVTPAVLAISLDAPLNPNL